MTLSTSFLAGPAHVRRDEGSGTPALAERLKRDYAGLSERDLLAVMLSDEFAGRAAVVASFGTESAVLLDLVAAVDPATPVIFLDTGKHFRETLDYRDALVRRLGLSDVRNATPSTALVRRRDRDGTLWQMDADACCHLRKVLPLQQAVADFELVVTGRKRAHGNLRAAVEPIEAFGERIRLNPLAYWSEADIEARFVARDLPRHPLAAAGFRSVGCAPCSHPTLAGSESRAGRWAGSAKTECGIHLSPDGRLVRGAG